MSDFIYGSELQEHHCRLGWEFFVFRKSDTDAKDDHRHGLRFFASWESGMGGEKWINDLVISGKAEFLKAGGLFRSYTLTAGIFVDVLRDGVPQHTGPVVVGGLALDALRAAWWCFGRLLGLALVIQLAVPLIRCGLADLIRLNFDGMGDDEGDGGAGRRATVGRLDTLLHDTLLVNGDGRNFLVLGFRLFR